MARRVKFFSGNGSSPSPAASGHCSDEVIQRDSATSAGEDDAHDDAHPRELARGSSTSSQGRTMLRRRRQFDAQGNKSFFFIIYTAKEKYLTVCFLYNGQEKKFNEP